MPERRCGESQDGSLYPVAPTRVVSLRRLRSGAYCASRFSQPCPGFQEPIRFFQPVWFHQTNHVPIGTMHILSSFPQPMACYPDTSSTFHRFLPMQHAASCAPVKRQTSNGAPPTTRCFPNHVSNHAHMGADLAMLIHNRYRAANASPQKHTTTG